VNTAALGNLNGLLLALALGILLYISLLKKPWRTSLLIAIVSPFDGLFTFLFGLAGNLVTPAILAPFLVTKGFSGAKQIFFATRTQKLIILILLFSLPSHIQIIFENPIFGLSLLAQKISLLIIVGAMAYIMATQKKTALVFKTLIVSMTIYVAFSLAEFAFAFEILPKSHNIYQHDLIRGSDLEIDNQKLLGFSRLKGMSDTLTTNRLGMWLQLPLFLSFAWFFGGKRQLRNWPAMICMIILGCGLMATISRSSIMGTIIGLFVAGLHLFIKRPRQIMIALFVLVILLGTTFGLTSKYYNYDLIAHRFSNKSQNTDSKLRFARWQIAMQIFKSSPIFGIGINQYLVFAKNAGIKYSADAHNGFLLILSEQGLLIFIPFIILLVFMFQTLWRASRNFSDKYQIWSAFVLGSLCAQIVINLFNSYFWERMFWLTISYVIFYEMTQIYSRKNPLLEQPA
jgi:hypothetical protein